MTNSNKWKEYFALRKQRSAQVEELVTKHHLKGDVKLICQIILDIHEAFPSSLNTTIPDLFKLIYACINERTKISMKLTSTSIQIEGKKRIQKLIPLLEKAFIQEINKASNAPYFIHLIPHLKWKHDNILSTPARIEPQTLNPIRETLNTEEFHIYDEENNKLALSGIKHEHANMIFKTMTTFEREGNRYYLSYLLLAWKNTLTHNHVFNPKLKFMGNKEAAFLYDLLPILGINDIQSIDIQNNDEKRDAIRTEIRRINKLIYIK